MHHLDSTSDIACSDFGDRCSNGIEQRCVPEFEWCCACGRARSDVADRAAETASGTGRAGMQLLPVSTQRSDPLQRSMMFVNLYLYVFWGRNVKTYCNTSRIAGHKSKRVFGLFVRYF